MKPRSKKKLVSVPQQKLLLSVPADIDVTSSSPLDLNTLWLSLWLPQLALEIFATDDTASAVVIHDDKGQRRWIHALDNKASARGIQIGMSLSAARSLCHDVQALARDQTAEIAALERIAAWALQFTSHVSLCPPDGLLLEIGASLQLFGGIAPLQTRISDELTALGYSAQMGIAPTPLAAQLLARAGDVEPLIDPQQFMPRLRQLPLRLLNLSDNVLTRLHGMGLRRIGDCLRLPRAGLNQRLGRELLLQLDQACGRLPDPHPAFQPPPCFNGRIALPTEVDNSAALLFVVQRLLLELHGFLAAKGCGIQALKLTLEHVNCASSSLLLGLVRPSRDVEHLLTLWRERLEHYTLPAPVDAIVLSAEHFLPLEIPHQVLFTEHKNALAWPQLVERMRVRLGNDAVTGICQIADHRPEYSWRHCAPGEVTANLSFPQRPLWLLPQPLLLQACDGHPCYDGILKLLQGPERIESGWWDEIVVARDYYVACNENGEKFWIFRELIPDRSWFLHGVFA